MFLRLADLIEIAHVSICLAIKEWVTDLFKGTNIADQESRLSMAKIDCSRLVDIFD
jgi:hypothetical protein